MKQILFEEKYPIYSVELKKNEIKFKSVDEIIDYFKQRILEHPVAKFIAIFDHFSHTKNLQDGVVNPEILDAKDIIFCFGVTLPNPEVMAIRPRSIGVSELKDKYIICFMEAPMPIANSAMENWTQFLQTATETIN